MYYAYWIFSEIDILLIFECGKIYGINAFRCNIVKFLSVILTCVIIVCFEVNSEQLVLAAVKDGRVLYDRVNFN